jgi:broad specificity phosphatase PhoE
VAAVYVVRHGETEWNREGRYQGRRESALTPLGERQAAALAEALHADGITRVLSSPLSRCRRTAAPVAQALGIEIEIDDRLVEIAHGTWEGRLRQDVELDDPERMRQWRAAPDAVVFDRGESLAQVDRRWRGFAEEIDGNDGDVVVVTHDVLVRVAVLAATNRPLADLWKPTVANGGYAVFQVDAGRWRLIEECRQRHLAGMAADIGGQAL